MMSVLRVGNGAEKVLCLLLRHACIRALKGGNGKLLTLEGMSSSMFVAEPSM